jgi:hypothetical protein
VTDLPLAALKAADSFLQYRALYRISNPEPQHFAAWAEMREDCPDALLDLATSMALIAPALVRAIDAARELQKPRLNPSPYNAVQVAESRVRKTGREGAPPERARVWNPLAPPSRRPPVSRKVSVEPHDLPSEWQSALKRMAQGLPSNGVMAPSKDILKRMREKLCQLAWSARRAGLPVALSEPVLTRFEMDVRARSEARKHGLRWATVRASVEDVDRFARYTAADEDFLALCRFQLRRLVCLEASQKALKFFELARTNNTTLGLLDLADEIFEAACHEDNLRQRHLMLNRAAILGVFTVAPLRNASADLVFGRTLFFEGSEWVIVTQVQKTQRYNPEPFVYPLKPQHGRFIDAVILQGRDASLLPALRAAVVAEERPLFVHYDGSAVGATYIARVFKDVTGNSFTSLRTMLHTDLGVAHGTAGTEMAMVAAHQTSLATAQKYKAQIVALSAAKRAQERMRRRRQGYFSDEPLC